jgi:tetratricopeptide (TPR) repeat protein
MVLPARRAVVIGMIGAWILLPPAVIPLAGLPDYNKAMAATSGIIIGTLIFEPNRLLNFRPRWFDVPALGWCFSPLASSLSNGLGVYDGLSASLSNIVYWVLPYLIGRLYLSDYEGMRELTIGIVMGGLLSTLFCIYEIKMSPRLLIQVYGIGRWEGERMGGYRPRAFFATGLELGMWMTAVSLTATWLWRCGTLKQIGQHPFGGLFLPVLLVTTVLCRSTGALSLLVAGIATLWICTRLNSKVLMCVLLLSAPIYYAVRIPNLWRAEELVKLVSTYLSAERAQSFEFRLQNEDILVQKALQQPVFGWGGWGRSRVYDKFGKDVSITDGYWIICLGHYGLVGLFFWTTFLLLPAALFFVRYPVRQWQGSTVAPLAIVATLLGLYMIDCLLNGFVNLVYITASGGLIGALPSFSRWRMWPHDASESIPSTRPDQSQLSSHESGNSLDRKPQQSNNLIAISNDTHLMSQMRLTNRYQQLARVLKDKGKPTQAKSAWMHALNLLTDITSTHPGVPEFQRQWSGCVNDLAWFLLSEPNSAPGDLVQAVHLATRATEVNPECTIYWNTLGAAHYRAGDATSAIAALERSIALCKTGTGFDHVFLAMAYARLGQQEPAQHWYDQATRWIEQHESPPMELRWLHEEARALLTSNPSTTSGA